MSDNNAANQTQLFLFLRKRFGIDVSNKIIDKFKLVSIMSLSTLRNDDIMKCDNLLEMQKEVLIEVRDKAEQEVRERRKLRLPVQRSLNPYFVNV